MLNYVVSFGGFLAIGNFLPNHLLKYHETDDTITLLITASFLTLICVKRVVYGPLTDKMGGPNSTMLGMLVTAVGAVLFAISPRGNFWDWRPLAGVFFLTSGMGCAASGTFRWIPLAFPGKTGPVGGAVGAVGALGGFILSSILGALGGDAVSVHLFTGLSLFMILLNLILKAQPTPMRSEYGIVDEKKPPKKVVKSSSLKELIAECGNCGNNMAKCRCDKDAGIFDEGDRLGIDMEQRKPRTERSPVKLIARNGRV